jgi:hypothetical protein
LQTETFAPATAISTVTPIALPSMTPAPTLTLETPDWSSIIRLSVEIPCTLQLLPPTIDPVQDIAFAKQQALEAIANEESRSWLSAGDSAEIVIRVSSITKSQEWIEIGNQLLLDISVQEDLPEHLNLIHYGDCGGQGKIRNFSPIDLTAEFDAYSLQSSFTEFDFFTLEPGEFEDFIVPFTCKAVGIFQIKVNMSYVYANIPNVTDSDQTATFVCPQTFTVWEFIGREFLNYDNYRWNGEGYEKAP